MCLTFNYVLLINMYFFVSKLILTTGWLQLLENNSREGCIDGLRGYLAIFVFIHNYAITYIWKTTGEWSSPGFVYFNSMESVGVSVFFVITGYLFTLKLLKSPKINWKRLYILE